MMPPKTIGKENILRWHVIEEGYSRGGSRKLQLIIRNIIFLDLSGVCRIYQLKNFTFSSHSLFILNTFICTSLCI